VVGGILVLATWFIKGRDPQIGLVAEYIPEPPDDLRPGAAGVLADETFHSRDVVATVLDLARRGVIKMQPAEGPGMSQTYTFVAQDHKEELRNYERTVLEVIFGSPKPASGTEVTMPQVAGTLASRNDQIAEGFYKELVDHQYFRESPQKVRDRWRRLFKTLPLLIIAGVVAIVIVVGAWSNFALFPIAIGILSLIVASGLSRSMPQKTIAGAESAAKWRAFRKYLQDIEDRQDIAASKEIFEKYLPYAVALGLAESWVQKFARVATPTPDWYGGGGPLIGGGRTVIIGDGYGGGMRRRRSGGSWTTIPSNPMQPWGGSQGGSGGGGFDFPDLQESSDMGGRTLQSGSDSFFGMLGNVAKAFAESSGSGSGSFGSFGGGRGGGFSGGGSRGGGFRGGGGGGGGRRGFK
jgi:uncharacterized protein (TIGR04222 family)